MEAKVGPTANLSSSAVAYGDAVPTARRHLNATQFAKPVKVASATEDNGWLGPLGSYGQSSGPGSLYGYGVVNSISSDWPGY